ncbi:hypothetical protein [Halotia branconii]|uniref:Uncharacterized protein n=1 Tax=Halotia branconii CENA392 TaxID=1539056 RepID=A0AAJ6NR56_9CYAN|nr:hypothetical protein [Halotia branconii]WGV24984.1 hypothetical protein QI031_24975 [Halotia branconii CENA392]
MVILIALLVMGDVIQAFVLPEDYCTTAIAFPFYFKFRVLKCNDGVLKAMPGLGYAYALPFCSKFLVSR